jgi:putative tricarboxylic transport membrane protein
VLRIPRPYLYAGIMAFAGLGAYALHFNVFDTLTLLVVGVVGFLMRRYGYPVAPMVVGGILGPMAEEQLRKSMAISQGDLAYLVHSPFAVAAYVTLAVIVVTGIWLKRRKARLEASPTLVATAAIAAVDTGSEAAGRGPRARE